mmetsp:Transcript_15349/g.33728  ORF Transcript_15349/g.33728 Transcript_15349/m.33728 type:complete len:109 (-) Transcript_15349:228-554(-)
MESRGAPRARRIRASRSVPAHIRPEDHLARAQLVRFDLTKELSSARSDNRAQHRALLRRTEQSRSLPQLNEKVAAPAPQPGATPKRAASRPEPVVFPLPLHMVYTLGC